MTLASFGIEAQVVTRGPYMTKATQNGIVIHWSTDIPTSSRVQVGLSPSILNSTFSNLTYTTQHVVQMNNLLPYTKYYYSIGTTTQVLQADSLQHFKTLPFASPLFDKPIRFWAVGDIGKQTQQQINVRNSFLQYVGQKHVDGWIMLGDNAYNNGLDIEYQQGFFNYYQQSVLKNIVLWPALGNHDYANNYTLRTTHQVPYLDIFTLPQNGECGGMPSQTERYYSFDYGNIHFVNLDSYGLENIAGNFYGFTDTIFSPQIQWLKYDLSTNQLPWVVVSFHHPPYCMGTHNSDIETDLVEIRTKLNPILERYNVDLVLNGHCHSYQRSQLIKNHFGLEATFDSVLHRVQATSGTHNGLPNSCAFIKNQHTLQSKDSGVLYVVVGSGGAIPQLPFAAWPHNAMQYSNYQDNGSLLLTVEGNKMLGEWISTDTNEIVKDRFVIYKNVGQFNTIHTLFPATVNLKASWNDANNYNWSTGDTIREIQFQATSDTILYVQDSMGCLKDTFWITNSPNALVDAEYTDQSIIVYPNPVQGLLKIKTLKSGWYDVAIYTRTGELLFQQHQSTESNQLQLELPSYFAHGEYILKLVDTQHHQWQSKFVYE